MKSDSIFIYMLIIAAIGAISFGQVVGGYSWLAWEFGVFLGFGFGIVITIQKKRESTN